MLNITNNQFILVLLVLGVLAYLTGYFEEYLGAIAYMVADEIVTRIKVLKDEAREKAKNEDVDDIESDNNDPV